MDLRTRVIAAAMGRPGVLLVASPGGTRERLAVEAELARRRWPQVDGPASADLVVFTGTAVPVREDDWAQRLWLGVPAPKARVAVTDTAHVAHVLDEGHAALLKPSAEQDHGAHADHGPQGHHDHQGHHMGVVAGLPVAERADDRDGLRLDRLHVPLGPALSDWPAGLVLRVELQGDVVQRAEVEPIPPSPSPRLAFWSEPWLRALAGERVTVGEAARRRCAAHLDSIGRFLAVAGWRDTAAAARTARDRVLDDAPVAELRPLVRRLIRRVRASWTLRRLTAGVGELSAEHAHRHRVSGPALLADGDVHDRLTVWLDETERALGLCDDGGALTARPLVGPRGRVDAQTPPSRALLDVLPQLLEGAEFACARLIVASLDPDLDELARPHMSEGHTDG